MVVVLSDVYETLRAIEARNDDKDDSAWEAPSSFERTTIKYWVEEDRLTELLITAAGEAPLLVYGKKGRLSSKTTNQSEGNKLWDTLATPISSVYFDSPNMDMYKERIARREGAQLFRVRWYGKKPSGTSTSISNSRLTTRSGSTPSLSRSECRFEKRICLPFSSTRPGAWKTPSHGPCRFSFVG